MKYVIIGNSAAGISAVEGIRSKDKKGELLIISNERFGPYCRVLTSNYIAGELKEPEMLMRDRNFYRKLDIKLLSGRKVKKLFSKKKIVEITDGQKISYDKVLIATGADPTFPDIPGIRLKGVFGLRTIEDARGIVKRLPTTKRVLIIGGGLVSCKAAYSIVKIGVRVTIVVASNRLLSQMLDNAASRIIQKRAEALGVEIKFGADVKEILGKCSPRPEPCAESSSASNSGHSGVSRPHGFANEVTGAILTDGTKINCEMVIVGKGVKPNTDFLKGSGVKVDRGVIADRYLNTNISNIYVAGDVTQVYDMLYKDNRINAMWPNAVAQGRIAGLNMAGEKIIYDGSYSVNIGEFFGLPAVSLGISRPPQDGFEEIVINNSKSGKYKKFVLKDKKLVGYINIGDIRGSGFINNLIYSEKDVSENLSDLKLRRYNISLALKNQFL